MTQGIIELVLLLAPPMIAAKYHWKLFKVAAEYEKKKWVSYGLTALVYGILIITVIAGSGFLRGHGGGSYASLFSTMGNVMKYGVLVCALTLLLPNIAFMAHTILAEKIQKRRKSLPEKEEAPHELEK